MTLPRINKLENGSGLETAVSALWQKPMALTFAEICSLAIRQFYRIVSIPATAGGQGFFKTGYFEQKLYIRSTEKEAIVFHYT
jgi:hypothetical protein